MDSNEYRQRKKKQGYFFVSVELGPEFRAVIDAEKERLGIYGDAGVVRYLLKQMLFDK